eukprot:GHVQ01036399.1.p1 GENE.GHVQ01036399.1~~GHVQ01036399.1.p1  ORF type:complete len:336 (-),score=64.73 GHVQ01036399.1:563-1570(-)
MVWSSQIYIYVCVYIPYEFGPFLCLMLLLSEKVQHMLKTECDTERGSLKTKADEVFGEDLGIHRIREKQQKHFKQLAAERTGVEIQKSGTGADGNSALTLGSLRKSAVTWDYDHDLEMTDDEEDVAHDGAAEEHADADILAEGEDGEDEFEDAEMSLTTYGQTLKTLLKRKEEEDEEDELAQYNDDNDEQEEEGSTAETTSKPAGTATSFFFPSSSSSTSSGEMASETAPSSVPTEPPDTKMDTVAAGAPKDDTSAPPSALSKEKQWEQRVIRKLQQNGGRMNIRDFMEAFKLKSKDSEFRLLQQIVKKLCSAQSEKDINGNENKFVQLKPEYRR